jgi:hypothetical protein
VFQTAAGLVFSRLTSELRVDDDGIVRVPVPDTARGALIVVADPAAGDTWRVLVAARGSRRPEYLPLVRDGSSFVIRGLEPGEYCLLWDSSAARVPLADVVVPPVEQPVVVHAEPPVLGPVRVVVTNWADLPPHARSGTLFVEGTPNRAPPRDGEFSVALAPPLARYRAAALRSRSVIGDVQGIVAVRGDHDVEVRLAVDDLRACRFVPRLAGELRVEVATAGWAGMPNVATALFGQVAPGPSGEYLTAGGGPHVVRVFERAAGTNAFRGLIEIGSATTVVDPGGRLVRGENRSDQKGIVRFALRVAGERHETMVWTGDPGAFELWVPDGVDAIVTGAVGRRHRLPPDADPIVVQ